MRTRSLPAKVGALSFAALLTLAACGSDSEGSSSDEKATDAAETTVADDATETTMADDAAEDPGTIVDIAAGNEDFSTLVAAVTAAELGETLSGEGPFTVFAPTNDAFAALPEGTVDNLLLPENKETLAGILTYHVVAGEVMAADLTDGQEVETVNGEILTVSVGDTVTLTDATGATVTVTTADVDASNGVIHIIDGVLLPSA